MFDLFFPVNFRFLCNPGRPAVCGRFGLHSDRLWRFEFVVLKGEDGEKMAKPEMVKKIVFPYITHPGKRYGYVFFVFNSPLFSSQLLTKISVFRTMSNTRKTVLKFYGLDHLCSRLEAATNGQKIVLYYVEMLLMSSHHVRIRTTIAIMWKCANTCPSWWSRDCFGIS